MPKYPIINARQLIKILENHNFNLIHSKGSHQIFHNPETKKTVSVPVHRGKDLGRGITRSILKDAGISLNFLLKKGK